MRSRILDACEALANLIALCSHIRERMTDKDEHDEEYDKLDTMYQVILLERRTLQAKIEEAIDKSNWHYHCILKHALAYYIYSSELEDADNNMFNWLMDSWSDVLNYALSLMAKEEVTLCSRCLADKILDNNKEE